jgi:hypothetical protein
MQMNAVKDLKTTLITIWKAIRHDFTRPLRWYEVAGVLLFVAVIFANNSE